MDHGRRLRKLKPSGCRASARGFSLIELVLVVLVILVLTAFTLPIVNNAARGYNHQAAVTTATAGIQATRYQAIFHGCPYQLAFTNNATIQTYQYQVLSELPNPPTSPPSCNAAFANVGGAIPLGARGATLNAAVTLTFNPDGSVSVAPAAMQNNIVVSYRGKSKNIGVSNYGSVKTCDGASPCP